MINHFGGLTDDIVRRHRHGTIAADEIHMGRLVIDETRLGILGKVEHHRPRSSAAGYVESTAHGPGHILRTSNLIGPLGDGLRNTNDIDLLKGIGAHDGGIHLSAYHHKGRGVNHGVGNACHCVHGPRATGGNGNSHTTAHTGIALSCMDGTLLMTDKYVMQTFAMVVERIIGGHDGTARIPEEDIYALGFQAAHQSLRSCNQLFHYLLTLN